MNQIIEKENKDKDLLTRVADDVIQGKTAYTHKLGRKRLGIGVKNILDTLASTRSINETAKVLNCSRGHIYGVLKENGMTTKEVLTK